MSKERSPDHLSGYLARIPEELLSESGKKFQANSREVSKKMSMPDRPSHEFDKIISHVRKQDLSEKGKRLRREAIQRLSEPRWMTYEEFNFTNPLAATYVVEKTILLPSDYELSIRVARTLRFI